MQVLSDDEEDEGSRSGGSTIVKQFHLTSWPDHGVPASSKPMLELCISLMNQAGSTETAPIVVHCSAGVGRTGTLLAVLMIIKDIDVRRKEEIDVTTVVQRMREQRPKMVQTLVSQLHLFLHQERLRFPHSFRSNTSLSTAASRTTLTPRAQTSGPASLAPGNLTTTTLSRPRVKSEEDSITLVVPNLVR